MLKSNDSPLSQTPTPLMGVAPCNLTITKVLRAEGPVFLTTAGFLGDCRHIITTQAPGCHVNTWETEHSHGQAAIEIESMNEIHQYIFTLDGVEPIPAFPEAIESVQFPRDTSYTTVGLALPINKHCSRFTANKHKVGLVMCSES